MNRHLKDALRSIRDFIPNRVHRWQRARQISAERTHYSKEQLLTDLDNLPVPAGAVVLVHSSLKAIGYVDGGPQTVVEALEESIVRRRGGTLLVPTYTINGTMRTTLALAQQERSIAFDAASTPSNLGAIPETFRRHPGVHRSVHPTHSFGALGPLAQQLVEGHHTCGSTFGRGSPMAKMLDHDGWLLGLGTNLGTVTIYHCLEELEDDFPLEVYSPDSPFSVLCRDAHGQTHDLTLSAHDETVSATRIDRPQNSAIREYFTTQFERNAGLSWHSVCEAESWLVSARRLYDETNRLAHSGITIYTSEAELEREAC